MSWVTNWRNNSILPWIGGWDNHVEINWAAYDATNNTGPFTFTTNNNTGKNINLIPLTRTTFVVLYMGASDYIYGKVGTVDGDGNVTFGAEQELFPLATSTFSASGIDSGRAVITLVSAITGLLGIVISIDGETITPGNPVSLGGAINNVSFIGVEIVNNISGTYPFLLAYYNLDDSSISAQYGAVTGTSITPGDAEYVVPPTQAISQMALSKIAPDYVVLTYGAGDPAGNLTAFAISYEDGTPFTVNGLTNIGGQASVNTVAHIRDTNTTGFGSNGQVIAVYENITPDPNALQGTVISWSYATSMGSTAPVSFGTGDIAEISVALPSISYCVGAFTVNAALLTQVTEISNLLVAPTLTSLLTYPTYTNVRSIATLPMLNGNCILVAFDDIENGDQGKLIVLRPGGL